MVKEDTKDVTTESSYWNNFYTSFKTGAPCSQFCVMLSTETDKAHPIVEFGCGDGRDSIFLARQGYSVFAGDLSQEAISCNQKKYDGADFSICDVANADHVKGIVNKARGEQEVNLILYNRFFLHSIDDQQEKLFLTSVSEVTKTGDKLYMEFRCSLDANLDKIYKGHYRRYVDTDKLVTMMQDELGFDVTYQVTGQGMAKYKQEDPFVSRIIAEKR